MELIQQVKQFQEKLTQRYDALEQEVKGVRAQADAIDSKLCEKHLGAGFESKSLAQSIWDDGEFKRLMRDKRGSAVLHFDKMPAELQRKTVITSAAVGTATSGVLQLQRYPGVVPAARRRLFVRDLLTTFPCTNTGIDYVKVNADISNASPQTEASAKFENAMTFTTGTNLVRTIATWIPATRQVLDDFGVLQQTIEGALAYAVRKEEEEQILSGDNTGDNLHGILTQATSFDTNLLSATDGWEYVDILARAAQQIETANESTPDFAALSPASYWTIRLLKDSTGQYIFGPPNVDTGTLSAFGLTLIRSTSMTGSTFLVGSSAPECAAIFERMGLSIDISTEHSTFFTENKIALRAEERIALVVFRPAAYITGSFNSSPA